MFEKEEALLKEMRTKTDMISVPFDELDDAITAGFQKAKKKKRPYPFRWAALAASLFIFTFITLIRVSPAFASYVSSIPGMEHVVEIIRYNKGLMSAAENDFVQEISVSDEKNGIVITLNSAIVDQRKLRIFYTIQNKSEKAEAGLKNVQLTSGTNNLNENAMISFGHTDETIAHNESKHSSIDFDFAEPMNHEDFKLNIVVKTQRPLSRAQEDTFQFEFKLDQDLVKEKMREIEMNNTVSVENQKITFKKLEITPLSAALYVEYDKENTMELFAFDDIRLTDEKGEPWSLFHNGLVGTEVSDTEDVIYLESNYFETPKELYLEFSRIRGVSKDYAEVIIDPVKHTVVKQPQDDVFSLIEVTANEVRFTYTEDREMSSMLINDVTDANGKSVYVHSSNEDFGDGKKRFSVRFDRRKAGFGPLTMKFIDYPGFIKEKTKINIK
ncbi:DUF4179 domain-containing protein [Metabacillus indicus]|uniref:DUF4179 domain-containing protein n=1 Tax=Metabacillus indicus TaxID=246786 RepID=UPI002A0827D3|nr:DUF4179 domain-containing protein [Metabacillus indicus]MDX8290883.1 DUF4179 domain-containing protein [Metabacillus indicus]